VTGGGLTVIANAPNPAGFAILRGHFDDEAINPLGLFVTALPRRSSRSSRSSVVDVTGAPPAMRFAAVAVPATRGAEQVESPDRARRAAPGFPPSPNVALALIVILPFAGRSCRRCSRASAAGRRHSRRSASVRSRSVCCYRCAAVFGGEVVHAGRPWLPRLVSTRIFLDGLGFLFALLILVIGCSDRLRALPSAGTRSRGRFHALLLLVPGRDARHRPVGQRAATARVWKLTSLASFLLIGYWRHLPESRQGARMALTVTAGGGLR